MGKNSIRGGQPSGQHNDFSLSPLGVTQLHGIYLRLGHVRALIPHMRSKLRVSNSHGIGIRIQCRLSTCLGVCDPSMAF